MPHYDAIVLGLGAMGSAALFQLAKRGARVLGIDRFSPPHDFGSSHGDTRITRLAIGEGAHFTPLVRRSHEIWREIERDTGAALLTQCGELIISSDNNAASTHVENFFRKTVAAARRHDIAHEVLDAVQVRARFPMFKIGDDEYAYFEPEGGFVRPERCIQAQLKLAQRHGGEVHTGECAVGYSQRGGKVLVVTDRASYESDMLILAAGAWLPGLLPACSHLFRVYRQAVFWFSVDGSTESFRPGNCPVFIWELPDSRQGIYGIPAIDEAGLKIATEQYAQTTDPGEVERDVSAEEIATMYRDFVSPYLYGVSPRALKTSTCLYTRTPDAGFVIDRLPDAPRVIVVSCCSGHGFKHSAAIGEALAELALDLPGSFDFAPFRLSRF